MPRDQTPTDEFSTRVRQGLADALSATDDFLNIGREITARQSQDQLHELVRRLLLTVSNSMKSVRILVEHGCGTDAIILARTMFETALNIHYLDSHPETLPDYLDFEWVKMKKHHDYLLKHAPAQAQALDQARLSELQAEYARVCPRFLGPKGRVRNQWHRSDRREIARTVGGESMYGGLYPFISSLTHMDILGLKIASQPKGEVEAVPSESNLPLGLHVALVSYALALTATNEVLKAGAEQGILSAFEKFKQSASVAQTLNLWSSLGT